MTIPVHVGDEIPEFLMGAKWLEVMELAVNKPGGILTLSRIMSFDCGGKNKHQ